MPKFYEFFAGGGMARAGLGKKWSCLFANDFDHKKGAIYQKNWGGSALKVADVKSIKTSDLPDYADLVWGSFPCQDLSLAGGGAGLKGDRSGTFWPFWSLMKELIKDNRAPPMLVLENVCGTLTSHGGKDFSAICNAFDTENYKFGAVVIDAALFVPHSRPRLFIVGIREDIEIPPNLVSESPSLLWHTKGLRTAYENLPTKAKKNWVWWNLATPQARITRFVDIIEENPDSVNWHSEAETKKLIAMMSKVHKEKLTKAKKLGKKTVGAIYKRTRFDENGFKVQRAEIRFDEMAGCLRTPAGGSSRQLIMIVDGEKVRSRLVSSRETARLMGLSEEYILPENYNEAYHLTGDGVAVPVVTHLAENILNPILNYQKKYLKKAA